MIDPIYFDVVYVGATGNLGVRKSSHITRIKHYRRLSIKSKMYHYLYQIYKRFKKLPRFEVECVVNSKVGMIAEIRCLKKYIKAGHLPMNYWWPMSNHHKTGGGMLIDTEKLKKAIQARDDDIDWEKLPMSRLNSLEKRCLDSLEAVEKVESLYSDLIVS